MAVGFWAFDPNFDEIGESSADKAAACQAIRSKGQRARLYVYFPLPLAAAIGLQAGEEVQWELLDRGELHLVRKQLPQLQATLFSHFAQAFPRVRESAVTLRGQERGSTDGCTPKGVETAN